MNIVVRYSRRSRYLRLSIGVRGSVNVSAPIGTPPAAIERFIASNEAWINEQLARREQLSSCRDRFYDSLPLATAAQRREATRRLNEAILPLVERYSREMGVKPSMIRYKAMRSRWGSCQTRSRSIVFSVYLLLLPQICVEHVVVHELAHLIVPNHSKDFYAVMDRFFPRWKEARTLAKNVLVELVEDPEKNFDEDIILE